MNRGELLKMLTEFAKDYAPKAKESIVKNRHMNQLGESVTVTQDEVDAILVDFINHVGMMQGIDFALNTSDLRV